MSNKHVLPACSICAIAKSIPVILSWGRQLISHNISHNPICGFVSLSVHISQNFMRLCSNKSSILPFLASGLWSHNIKSRLEISWPEMMPPNIPYQILFLTCWLPQSRDQWPPQIMTLSFLQEWRQCWLLQITRRQLCCSCSLGSLSPHSDTPFDFTTNHSAAAQPSHVANQVFRSFRFYFRTLSFLRFMIKS